MATITWFAKFGHFGHHPRKRTKKKIFIDFRPIASDPGRLPIKETKSVFLRGPTPGRLEIFRFFQKFQKIHPRGSYGYERNPGNCAVETVLLLVETLLVESAPWKLFCGKCAVLWKLCCGKYDVRNCACDNCAVETVPWKNVQWKLCRGNFA